MEYQIPLFHALHAQVCKYLADKGFEIIETSIGRDDLTYCRGCFGCWIKKPGECVIDDMMTQVNRNFINCDVAIYLTPVVFGQFSANIKNALDRWLPNVMPFFITRPDGSTIHPGRYKSYPRQIMAAYADGLTDGDMKLFEDIIKRHRMNVDVVRFDGNQDSFKEALDQIRFGKVGAKL